MLIKAIVLRTTLLLASKRQFNDCNIASDIVTYAMKLVLDTAVMVAAVRSDAGASRWLLRSALERKRGLLLQISVPLLIEYEAVLTRAEHLTAAGVSIADIERLLDAVAAVAEPVRLSYLWRPTLPDANDDMVLEAAMNGSADGIVTFNLRDLRRATEHFELEVLLPGEAVKRLESGS